MVTFAVTASGLTLLGVGAAFWGLVAGGLMTLLHHRRTAPGAAPEEPSEEPSEEPRAEPSEEVSRR